MQKQAVIVYGPPGSGKSTQAELLSKKKGLIHFDTGGHLEAILHGKQAEKNPTLKRECKLWDTGALNTPSWVLKIVKRAAQKIARAGYGIVLSGSPRTKYEAFGDKNHPGLIAELEKLYGKKNVIIIHLKIKSEKEYVRRNAKRVVCSVCGLPFLAKAEVKRCAFCAGPPRKRTLDNPTIIETRLKEYKIRTLPILAELRKKGYRVLTIPGAAPPYKVHQDILRKI